MVLTLLRWVSRWPLRLAHAVGALLGWLVYAASPSYRDRLKTNAMAAGLTVSQRRSAVAHAGRMVAELPRLWLRPRDELWGDQVELVDEQGLMAQAVQAGHGVIVMTAHLGTFEIAAQIYAERHGANAPMTAMYRPARQAWLREFQLTARNRPGLVTAPASLAGIRQMMRALRRGEAVGILPDQVPPEGMGVWAPFFGREAYTMTLAARLAQQTGATVVILTGERLPRGRGFRLHVQGLPEPFPQPLGGDDAAHQAACAAVLNRTMEHQIRQFPEQYLWGYHRYKQPRRDQAGDGVSTP